MGKGLCPCFQGFSVQEYLHSTLRGNCCYIFIYWSNNGRIEQVLWPQCLSLLWWQYCIFLCTVNSPQRMKTLQVLRFAVVRTSESERFLLTSRDWQCNFTLIWKGLKKTSNFRAGGFSCCVGRSLQWKQLPLHSLEDDKAVLYLHSNYYKAIWQWWQLTTVFTPEKYLKTSCGHCLNHMSHLTHCMNEETNCKYTSLTVNLNFVATIHE